MLSVLILSILKLSALKQSINMLSVIILSVITLSVAAPHIFVAVFLFLFCNFHDVFRRNVSFRVRPSVRPSVRKCDESVFCYFPFFSVSNSAEAAYSPTRRVDKLSS
jgi:hypothetical protein